MHIDSVRSAEKSTALALAQNYTSRSLVSTGDRPPPCPQQLHTPTTPHHHQVVELSETNHNTLTGYTHMARVALNFGVGGHFGAVQWMDLQLSPTTTITIFLTKHLQARAAAAPRVL